MFLDLFDVLMSKISFFFLRNIILIHFRAKNILKATTTTLSNELLILTTLFEFLISCISQFIL
jgi:hypothetical protein